MPNINLIDRPKAIEYLSNLIADELDKLQISEQRLGWLMGRLSQGTINKLRQGKFNNIPDFDTLEAIAVYFGMSLSELIANLEGDCSKELDVNHDNQYLLGAVYQVTDLSVLTEINSAVANMIKVRLMQAQQ